MSNNNLNRKCIFVLVSGINEVKLAILNRMYEQAKNSDIDIWLGIDVMNKGDLFNEVKDKFNIYEFDYTTSFPQYNLFRIVKPDICKKSKIYYNGNCIYPFMDFSTKHDYDYYMFYEDDLLYTGNIIELYNKLVNDPHEFYTHVRYSKEPKRWTWTFECKHITDPSYTQYWSHLFTIYMAPKKTLQKINEVLLSKKWYWHHEGILATITRDMDLFYIEKILDKSNVTFRIDWFDDKMKEFNNGISSNSLFHPIKKMETYTSIVDRIED